MTNQERDKIIAEKLNEGMSLSDVQALLGKEYGIRMTYFDLRMIAADLEVDWTKQDKPKAPAPKPATPATPAPPAIDADEDMSDEPEDGEWPEDDAQDVETAADQEEQQPAATGETTVTLDDPPEPGAAASGTVKFASGASGKWLLMRNGRMGFDTDEGSAEPTEEDFAQFQDALRRKLSGEDEPADPNEGPTVVDVDAVMRPGVQLSGTVTFGSGAKGTWSIGPRGLGYDLEEGSSKPTRRDLIHFQQELQRVLAKKGMM